MVQYERPAYHNYAEMALCVTNIKAKYSIYSVHKHGVWRWSINDIDNDKRILSLLA